MKRVMVDIETMSTHTTNALILSVAMITFDLEHAKHIDSRSGVAEVEREVPIGPRLVQCNMWVLDTREQLSIGRQVDPATQAFWASQSNEARAHWADSDQCLSIDDFKAEFEAYLEDVDEVWANGILFDLGNLASLWGDKPPWHYRAPRDYKTIRDTLQPFSDRLERTRDDRYKHDPLEDCRHQIHELWRRWPFEHSENRDSVGRLVPRSVNEDRSR